MPSMLIDKDHMRADVRQECREPLPSRIPELDGIRAVAIWMVLALPVFVPDEESAR